MLLNYFTIAFRNLLKQKAFYFINIAGLSIGIACCVLLSLYIKDELSYERHFKDADRIYRITSTLVQENGTRSILQRTSPPVAMTMLEEFPEIASATRVVSPPEVEQHLIRRDDEVFYEKKGYLVDSTFLEVFSYDLQQGNRSTALDEPSTVILSHTLAQKLFADRSALNESLIITSGWSVDTFRVTGVLQPYTKKSHLHADFYMSMNSKGWGKFINSMDTWNTQNFMFSYLRLKPTASAEDLEAKFPALMEKYGAEEMKTMKRKKIMGLQPLTDIHLYSTHFDFNYDLTANGSIYYIYVMASVAAFILLIACINFMNLTTAKATQRAGEVGIRKTMGATRIQLIKQFLGESMTIVLIAMVLALGLIQLALPVFNAFIDRTLMFTSESWLYLIVFLVVISLITGIIAGSYPAFFLSSFQPARALKLKNLAGGSSNWIRKGLVVVQFVIAISLIASSIVIQRQLTFVQNRPLGFEADLTLMVPLRTQEARTKYPQVKDRFQQIAGVRQVSGSTSLPSTPLLRDLSLYPEGSSMDNAVHHYICNVDEAYFDLLNIPVLYGRDFILETDSFNVNKSINRAIVNRTSLKELGIPEEDAIGSKVFWTGPSFQDNKNRTLQYEIVGVVEDFHQASMHHAIAPIAFIIPSDQQNYIFMALSLAQVDYTTILPQLEAVWKKHIPDTPFESQFLSDNVENKYANDRQVSAVITVFTGIAIAISCLGLYGLSIYVGERRIKEIGIRKVLGASTATIVRMLSVEFIILVAIAFVIAVPIGYYAMREWLQNFAYRTNLNFTFFLLAGVLSFLIAWLTVGFESIRAARSNPVDSLRSE